jgi:hypothetical protein
MLRQGPAFTRQYFALVDARLALIRHEDSEGRATTDNAYHTLGPTFPLRSPEETQIALSSTNLAELLRTLAWLGGCRPEADLERTLDSLRQSRLEEDLATPSSEDPACARGSGSSRHIRTHGSVRPRPPWSDLALAK